MYEAKSPGVQCLPPERYAALLAVRPIADQRMSERGQVNADLVRAAGLEAAGEQRAVAETLAHLIARDGCFAGRDDRHRRAPDRMTADRRVDRATMDDVSGGERQIFAVDALCLQLAHKLCLGDLGLGHDQEAAGIFVQAMHDARASDTGELRRVVQQRVGKRAVAVAGSRMNDQPGRLVDDEDCFVLMHDLQRQRLRRKKSGGGFGQRVHQDPLAAADLAARIRGRTGKQHAAGVYPGPDAAARMLGQELRESAVQPHARTLGGYGQRALGARRGGRVIIHGYVWSRQ